MAPVSLTAQSPTGTSVQLSWPAANGGATPDHYVILRDGAQVAEVPGDETSWTNTGLRPGDKFQYEVATRGGGWQSGPSPVAMVTTLAPSPVGLKVASTYTTATLTWKPSPLGPAPDKYLVYDQGEQAATLDGATTTYVEHGLLEGAPFQYTVVAEWGTVSSAPSATDSGTIRSAPLMNLQDVNVTPTSIPSDATGGTVGRAFPTSWDFTPQCAMSACTMTVNLVVPGPQERGFPLTVKVTPSGADYTGSTQAKFAVCAGTVTTDTIKLTLVPDTSQISNGHWGHWTGTVVATDPVHPPSAMALLPIGELGLQRVLGRCRQCRRNRWFHGLVPVRSPCSALTPQRLNGTQSPPTRGFRRLDYAAAASRLATSSRTIGITCWPTSTASASRS